MKYKKGKKIILLYHRVNETVYDYNRITINEVNFRNQMQFLKNSVSILSLDELIAYEGTEDVVAITFDDGFVDFYTKALPILEQFQIPATVFVTTGKMNTSEELWTTDILRLIYMNDVGCEEITVRIYGREISLPFISLEQRAQAYRIVRHIMMQVSGEEQHIILKSLRKQLQMPVDGREAYQLLTEEQCRKIAKHPLITIGAHTVHHISMGKVEDTVLKYEIVQSVERLKEIVDDEIDYFAYPFGGQGDYSKHVIELLEQYNFKAAFTVGNCSYSEKLHNIYEIPRYYVGNWELYQFKKWLNEICMAEEQEKADLSNQNEFYVGDLADDEKLWNSDAEIIIWGSGVRGKRIREKLLLAGQHKRIIAYGDNNPALWGKQLDGIDILSLEDIKKFKEAIVIIYNTQDMKVYQQLTLAGIQKIHWII